MNKLILVFALILSTFLVHAEQPTTTKAKFTKLEHDFGSLPQGKPVTYEFEFTNTGDQPLILDNVQASCGCTTPTWTK